MADAKTKTMYHPDANLRVKREVAADMVPRFEAAGWKTSKPKGFDADAAE